MAFDSSRHSQTICQNCQRSFYAKWLSTRLLDRRHRCHITYDGAPNRVWFKDYKPCKVPVRLADNNCCRTSICAQVYITCALFASYDCQDELYSLTLFNTLYWLTVRLSLLSYKNNVIYAAGSGSIVFTPVKNGASLRQIEFTNVLHVPMLANNLLSVLTLTKKHNLGVIIKRSTMSFTLNSHLLCEASVSDDNIALLDSFTVVQAALRVSPLSPELWRRRFCHIGRDRLKELISGSFVKDLDVASLQSSPLPDICEYCLAGKQHRFPFPHTASNWRTKPLELIHSDVHGPISVQTPQKHQYWISFIDDCTRYRVVYVLQKKSDAFATFKEYKAFAEKQTGFTLKALRDNKGGEYMSKEMENFLKSHGIAREHTTTATPQQNSLQRMLEPQMGPGWCIYSKNSAILNVHHSLS